MHPRLARKIVARVTAGTAMAPSYRRDQVVDAFRVMGVPLTAEHLQPWTETQERQSPKDLADAQRANRLRRERTLQVMTQRRLDREIRRAEAQARATKPPRILAQHVQSIRPPYGPAEVSVPTVDATSPGGTDETFDVLFNLYTKGSLDVGTILELVQNSDPVLNQAQTPVPVLTTTPDYTAMTLAELKSTAKERGLKGYSTLKKDALIALLTAP